MHNNIWLAIDALAAALDCGRDVVEQTLNSFERDLMKLPQSQRNELRQKMIFIVAQLSRLEVRLMTSEGPMGGSI